MHRVALLGGDGFIGWPLALRLALENSAQVLVVDSLLRRSTDVAIGNASLLPIALPLQRVAAANAEAARRPGCAGKVTFVHLDAAKHPVALVRELEAFAPTCVVHVAELRSAPFSMRSAGAAQLTVANNVVATSNLLAGMAHSPALRGVHVVHIGTMGVYGYDHQEGALVQEGYIDATVDGRTRCMRAPACPGSVYHATKVLDAGLFDVFARLHGMRVTDLHQGIVWGSQTAETALAPHLRNRTAYDETFGTVVNRFAAMVANGRRMPLYGGGEQRRAFIHLEDAVAAVAKIATAPWDPAAVAPGREVRILNQVCQVASPLDIATWIRAACEQTPSLAGVCSRMAEEHGEDAEWHEAVPNPRTEAPNNVLCVANERWRAASGSAAARQTEFAHGALAQLLQEAAGAPPWESTVNVDTATLWPGRQSAAA